MNEERCNWAGSDEIYIKYHDEEWGVPTHDDQELFEMLVLESFQAGLSWITILKKGKTSEKHLIILMLKKWPNMMKKK